MLQHKWIFPSAAALILAACASQPSAPVEDRDLGTARSGTLERTASGDFYTVVRGDTLYAISFRVGVDYRELARFNDIGEPFTIYPGQRIRVPGGQVSSVASAPLRQPSLNAQATTSGVRERDFAPRELPDEPSSGSAVTSGLGEPSNAPGQLISESPSNASTGERVGLSVPPINADNTTLAASAGSSALPSVSSAPKVPLPSAATVPTATLSSVPGAWRWPTEGRVMSTFLAGDPGRKGVDISGTVGQPINAAGDGEVVYSGEGLIGYGQLIIIKHSNALLSAYGHNRKRLVKEGERVKNGQQIAEMGATNGDQPALHFELRQGGKTVDPLRFLPKS